MIIKGCTPKKSDRSPSKWEPPNQTTMGFINPGSTLVITQLINSYDHYHGCPGHPVSFSADLFQRIVTDGIVDEKTLTKTMPSLQKKKPSTNSWLELPGLTICQRTNLFKQGDNPFPVKPGLWMISFPIGFPWKTVDVPRQNYKHQPFMDSYWWWNKGNFSWYNP